MRKLSSNYCPSSVDRCDALTEETESCTLESAVRGHHVYKTSWSPAIGQGCRSELKTATRTTDMLLLLVYAILLLDICLMNYPG